MVSFGAYHAENSGIILRIGTAVLGAVVLVVLWCSGAW